MIFKWWIQSQMFLNRREHSNRRMLFLLHLSMHIYLWCEIAIIYSVTIDKCYPFIEINGFLLDVPTVFKSFFLGRWVSAMDISTGREYRDIKYTLHPPSFESKMPLLQRNIANIQIYTWKSELFDSINIKHATKFAWLHTFI